MSGVLQDLFSMSVSDVGKYQDWKYEICNIG